MDVGIREADFGHFAEMTDTLAASSGMVDAPVVMECFDFNSYEV